MVRSKNLILYYRERLIFHFTNITAAAIVACFVFIWIKFRPIQASVPLHYDIFFGIDRLGRWTSLLQYPLIALITTIANFITSYLIFAKDKYLAYYLILMSAMISIVTVLHLTALSSIVL